MGARVGLQTPSWLAWLVVVVSGGLCGLYGQESVLKLCVCNVRCVVVLFVRVAHVVWVVCVLCLLYWDS